MPILFSVEFIGERTLIQWHSKLSKKLALRFDLPKKRLHTHCGIQLFQMFRIALLERHMFLCMSFASDHCSQTDCYLFAAILHAKLPIKLWYLLE
jgi:hypothetical protein